MLRKRQALSLPVRIIIAGTLLILLGLMVISLSGNLPQLSRMETPTEVILDRACADWRQQGCSGYYFQNAEKDWDRDGQLERFKNLFGDYLGPQSSQNGKNSLGPYAQKYCGCFEQNNIHLQDFSLEKIGYGQATSTVYRLGVFEGIASWFYSLFASPPEDVGEQGGRQKQQDVKASQELQGLTVALPLPYDYSRIERQTRSYLKSLLTAKAAKVKVKEYGRDSSDEPTQWDKRTAKTSNIRFFKRSSPDQLLVAITDAGHLSDYCQIEDFDDFNLDLGGDRSDGGKVFYYQDNEITGELADRLARTLNLEALAVGDWDCPFTVSHTQADALHLSLDLDQTNYREKAESVFHVLREYYLQNFRSQQPEAGPEGKEEGGTEENGEGMEDYGRCSGPYEEVEVEKRYDYDLKVTRLGLTSRSDLENYLEQHAPHLEEYADPLYRYAEKYCIDPAFGAAVMMHESKHGTSEIFDDCNNGFGQKNNDDIDYPDCQGHGKFVAYPSVEAGIETFYRRIRQLYVNDNQQVYPQDIACLEDIPQIPRDFREPCYVGLNGGRRAWNLKVTRYTLAIRKWDTNLDCSSEPLIIIDPGHGGPSRLEQSGPGAVSGGVEEQDLNLDMARKLHQRLSERGYQNLLMTRTEDRRVGLYQRTNQANAAYRINNCGLSEAVFISIHNNAAGKEANGTETFYYYKASPDRKRKSKRLASEIQRSLVATLGSYNRGVKVDDELVVIKYTGMPAVLTEIGFLTNSEERQKLTQDGYQQQAMEAVATAVDSYFQTQN